MSTFDATAPTTAGHGAHSAPRRTVKRLAAFRRFLALCTGLRSIPCAQHGPGRPMSMSMPMTALAA
ncbi:hypothetical protein GQ57_31640 [Burkholderia sp. MSh2]|nr:hypothetical protein GQ57_31640 [Burkholderia sp. MSh2]